MDPVEMGKRIRQKRMAESMTQEQLAEKTNLSVAYIGMLERGMRTPSLDAFIEIADQLHTTADELLYGTIRRGCQFRMLQYEEKIAQLSIEEKKKVYAIMDALLGME